MSRLFLAFIMMALAAPACATEAGWALLRNGGQVVLINHADAPGTGEPANFDINDCSTQRNLSDRGRQQARRMGALFEARAAPIEKVLTSRYCRARDTARLAFEDAQIEELKALDPFVDHPESEAAQTAAVRERILAHSGAGNLVMVTHQANIMALTGAAPRESEAVIVSRKDDGLGVAARIIFR